MTAAPALLIVIFGATGDLAQRMPLPSLYRLGRELFGGMRRLAGGAEQGACSLFEEA